MDTIILKLTFVAKEVKVDNGRYLSTTTYVGAISDM